MDGGGKRPGTREWFEAVWRHDVEMAGRFLLERGCVAAMFVIHPRNAPPIPVVAMFGDDEEKAACYELVRLLCVANDAVGIGLMAETWHLRNPGPGDARASLSPRREECVLVLMRGRSSEGEVALVSLRRIVRGPDGAPVGLEEMEVPRDGEAAMAGDLLDLLPGDTPPGEERRKARAAAERMMKRMRRGRGTVH